jgi:hypothetical protein
VQATDFLLQVLAAAVVSWGQPHHTPPPGHQGPVVSMATGVEAASVYFTPCALTPRWSSSRSHYTRETKHHTEGPETGLSETSINTAKGETKHHTEGPETGLSEISINTAKGETKHHTEGPETGLSETSINTAKGETKHHTK